MEDQQLLLLGCGIFKKEIKFLIEKNKWPIDTFFVDSSLHIDFEALASSLRHSLSQHRTRNIIVFYGACHPLMHKILEEHNVSRIPGQNCIEMLLGNEHFTEELSKGAFFLLEDWAKRWDEIVRKTFGGAFEIVKEIYSIDRKYLLCIKTACSSDYNDEAVKAAKTAGLPLHWIEADLEKLEMVLAVQIEKVLKLSL